MAVSEEIAREDQRRISELLQRNRCRCSFCNADFGPVSWTVYGTTKDGEVVLACTDCEPKVETVWLTGLYTRGASPKERKGWH